MAQQKTADAKRTVYVDPTNPHSPEPTGTHPYDEHGHAVGMGPRNRGAKVGLYVLAAIVVALLLFWLFGAGLYGTEETVVPAGNEVVAPAGDDVVAPADGN